MENIVMASPEVNYEQLLQEKDRLYLELINWKQEYDHLQNSSVEKLSISTTIADLRIRYADVQREILQRRLRKI